ncbi:MAG: hypothetical protein GY791_03640 [Alphaproteobacteria bacterium]|nr:hypothetical protein [Alphaproteobacteria bacterium]
MTERIAYAILIGLAVIWLVAIIAGSIAAWPYGVLGLLALLAVGLLFVKVVRERLASREDDYYSKNVDK